MPPPLPFALALASYSHAAAEFHATTPLPLHFALASVPSATLHGSASDHPTIESHIAQPSLSDRTSLPVLSGRLIWEDDDPPLVWASGGEVSMLRPEKALERSVPARALLATPVLQLSRTSIRPGGASSDLMGVTVLPAPRTWLPAASPTPAPATWVLARRGGDGDETEDCGCEETTTKVITVTA